MKQLVTILVGTLSLVSCIHLNRLNPIWINSKLSLTLNRFIPSWVVSSNSQALSESIHYYLESIQSSIWAAWIISYISWLASIFMYSSLSGLGFLDVWIDSIGQWIDSIFVFVRKLSLLTLYYINTFLLNFKIIESFASILSRSQKLNVHTFFEIIHFFFELLCSLSV